MPPGVSSFSAVAEAAQNSSEPCSYSVSIIGDGVPLLRRVESAGLAKMNEQEKACAGRFLQEALIRFG